ncbi:MAG: hypothetical protein WD076_09350 [Parvularculaceae bacterium]
MAYKTLKANCVIETIDQLERRIGERFPESGLRKVCQELGDTARRCAAEAARLNKPATAIRFSVYAIWALGAATLAWLATALHLERLSLDATSLVQVLEPTMNVAVLVGIGVLALGRLEERWKRARALDYLHELRSIAHVVDMHQLTKDPHRPALLVPPTASSPTHGLSAALLERYLDYCSEMVSLTGKLAALLAQSCRDSEVAAAASDVENLTTGLSRKIWQKMTVLARAGDAEDEAAAKLDISS